MLLGLKACQKNLVAVGFVITNTGSTSCHWLGVGQSASLFTPRDLPHLLSSHVGRSAAGFVVPPRLYSSDSSGFAFAVVLAGEGLPFKLAGESLPLRSCRLQLSVSVGFDIARKVQDSLILCLFEGCQCFVVALATRFGIPGSPLMSSKLKDLS